MSRVDCYLKESESPSLKVALRCLLTNLGATFMSPGTDEVIWSNLLFLEKSAISF